MEEHYSRRTTLRVNVLPADIAEAVVHFASPRRWGEEHRDMLNVDGGVVAAHAR